MAEMKKKKILVIRSFWTSDIRLDGNLIKNEKNEEGKIISSFRSKTEEICQNFDAFKERISFPILDSFLEKKIQREESVILKGIFTDQEGGHEGDTKFLFEILQKYYDKKIQFARSHIILTEPRLLQNNLETISENFSKANEDVFDKIYVCPTWWTKGIVSALFLASLEQLKMSKVSFYYGEEQEDKTTRFIKQDGIKSTSQKQFVATLLDHQDFDSLISYVEYNDLELFCEKEYRFAKYIVSRLNADYETCKNISDEHSLPSWTRKEIDSIEEKINGILYTRKKGRYVEFLGRIYNFTDAVIDFKVKELYGFSKDKKLLVKDTLTLLDTNEGLKEFLNNKQGINTKPLRWNCEEDTCLNPDDFMNKYVAQALVEFKVWKDSQLFQILNRLTVLNNYRNQTVIAHWNEDITKEKICDKYVRDLEEDFMFLLNSLCWKSDLWINKKA